MTGNEAELIERLIVEAAKRGAVEQQLTRAIKAAEDAAAMINADKLVIRKLTEQIERLNERANVAERPLNLFHAAAERLLLEIDKPSKFNRKNTFAACVSNLQRTALEAAPFCNSIPF
jgi:hypothetical protein